MLLDIITKGSTDRSVTLRIIDSTDGTPETGVVYNTSGIDLWYRREGATATAITEATLAGLDAAHSDGGFLHIDDGNYRLDLPDAAFATGANYVDVGGTVTGMVVIGGRVRLTNFDLEAATPGVNVTQISGGSTAADNLEAACNGGSYNVGGGAVVAASVTGAVGSVTGAVGSVTGNVGGNVAGSVASVTAGVTLANGAITAAVIATGAIDADAIADNAIDAGPLRRTPSRPPRSRPGPSMQPPSRPTWTLRRGAGLGWRRTTLIRNWLPYRLTRTYKRQPQRP